MKVDVGTPDLRDVNITVLDAAKLTPDLLASTCDTAPFLAEKRMVIVQGLLSRFERHRPSRARSRGDVDKAPGLGPWKELAAYLSSVPDTTDLVFVDGRLTASNPLLKAIRRKVETRVFPVLNPGELRQWIRRRAIAEGIEIEHRAIDTLAETIGSDLRVVAGELEKLSLYCWGRAIRHEDVDRLVSYTKEASIFRAVDAMMEGRADVAIRLLSQIIQSGSPAGYILFMMARQVRLLILAKEMRAQRVPHVEQGRRLGLSGYPLTKTLQQQERFSGERLVEIHRALVDADLSMKSTGADVLELLIAEVASKPAGGHQRRAARYR